jgi:LPXTG-site transpeptidase (sortase) family protein
VGTAFPTLRGNSVLTGHVVLPSGAPGPFARLSELRFGDHVIVHAWGLRHVYEIRQVEQVAPDDASAFRHEEQAWVTLLTCADYDTEQAAYLSRVLARAVLVAIEEGDGSSVWGAGVTNEEGGHRQIRYE